MCLTHIIVLYALIAHTKEEDEEIVHAHGLPVDMLRHADGPATT
jgi:hypothetical protein